MTAFAQKVILDLCGGTGAWSKPYAVAGYDVRVITLPDQDVRLYIPPENVYGVLAAPPCTEFAVSGARWWARKEPALLIIAVEVVETCLDIIDLAAPEWWCFENPVGRLPTLFPDRLGKAVMTFQPNEYGDPWTKRTCLWGKFNAPQKTPVEPIEGGKIWRMPPSEDRSTLRSITPPSFAQAFFEANQ